MIPPSWQARMGASVVMSAAKALAISLAVAALLGAVIVQTVRIEGLLIWPLEVQGWKGRALRAEARIEALERKVRAAQVEAALKAQRQREAKEGEYRTIAREADDESNRDTSAALAAADDYILRRSTAGGPAGGVCDGDAADRGAGSAAGTAAPDNGAASSEGMPADPHVPVSGADVRACAGAVSYALSARRYVLELEAASAAPGPGGGDDAGQ